MMKSIMLVIRNIPSFIIKTQFIWLGMTLVIWIHHPLQSQGVHDLDGTTDAILLLGGGISVGLGFHFTGKTPPITEEELNRLDPISINTLDRSTTRNWSPQAGRVSDVTLRISFASPFVLLADRNSRKEAGTIGIMMLESALLNNGLANFFKGSTQRERPFLYNSLAPLPPKLTKNGRHSFFSAHASNSASFAFLTAKIFSNNNPNSSWTPYIWTAAVTIPAVTSFLRVKAGKHYPTDVIVGYLVGAAIGIIIPELHR